MPKSRLFAYNTGSTIPGTTQVGSLAIGKPTAGFEATGLEWWGGPDENLGYVIAVPVPGDSQPTPISGVSASVGFFRSSSLSDSSFISTVNGIAGGAGPFSSAALAKNWLDSQGYWTSFVAATGATGSLFITITQNGSNVVLEGSGSLNINDLTFATSGNLGGGGLGPQTATFISGPNGIFDQYSGSITTPGTFGTGGGAYSSSTGDIFGVIVNMAPPPYFLAVPSGYTSGDPLSGTMTFNSQTIASLGLTEGTYNWTWGSGPNADGITMVIGGTGSTGGSGAGWEFYAAEGPLVDPPPISDGQAIFTDQLPGGGTNVTYNPNKSGGVDYLNFNLLDIDGVDYTSQFTTLQNSGGTISISQGINTATYVLTAGMAFIQNPEGFAVINAAAATQTVNASSPFVSGTPITISFS